MWAHRIDVAAKEVKDTSVSFNNHYRAKAAKGAEMLKSFVRESDFIRPG